MLKIISCAGFGNTGSSIVTDFFSEFSCVKTVGGSSFEFMLLHENDGIRDLEYAVTEGNRLKTDLSIKRFIKLVNRLNYANPSGANYKEYFNGHFLEYTYDYLNSLGIIKWNNGWWHRIYEIDGENKFKKILNQEKFKKITKKNKYSLYESDTWRPSYLNYTEEMYCKIEKKEFKEKTKLYLEKLFLEIAKDGEYLLFDQLFPTEVNQEYLEYFDFAKVIIVDRDPRDLYFMNKVFWGSGYIPSEKVELYINWFTKTRNNLSNNENILYLKFEDMIYETEKTQKKLCDFIGIEISKHDNPNTNLFVEKSITNTQVYNRYAITNKEIDEKIKNDLIEIEKQLNKYLYSFPKLDNIEVKKIDYTVECVYDIIEKNKKFNIGYLLIAIVKEILRRVYNIIKK